MNSIVLFEHMETLKTRKIQLNKKVRGVER